MPMLTSPRPGLEFGQGLIDFTDEDLYGIEINPFPYGNAPAELIYIDADPMGIESAYQTMRQILLDAGIDISDLSGTEIPEDLPEAITSVLQSAVQSQDISGIQDIAQDIISAGGYGDWLETQDVLLGDPGAPPSEIPEEFSDLEFDEEGNLVFVLDPGAITLPPIAGPMPVEDIAGGGSAPAPEETEVIVDPNQSSLPSSTIDEEGEVEADVGIPDFYTVREDGTVVTVIDPENPIDPDQIPSWVNVDVPGTYPESGPILDEDVAEEEPSRPITDVPVRAMPTITPDRPVRAQQPTPTVTIEAPTPPAQTETPATPQPTTGDGTQGTGDQGAGPGVGPETGPGTEDGTGDKVTAKGLMKPEFEPFMTALNYQPVQLQQQIAPARKDYMQQLDALIGRSLFGKMLG